MSLTKEKRETIKRYLLEKIQENNLDIAKRTSDSFHISLNTVYRYLRELESSHIIIREKNKYRLVQVVKLYELSRSKNELVYEDIIYKKYISSYMEELPQNVQKIWEYSFTEMMNNAIEHSNAGHVLIAIFKDYLNTTIMLIDNGIGIFKKIKEYYNLDTLDDAVNELFKGKLTTDTANHTGEGIFFTSRILDEFAAISDEKVFTHDKYNENYININEYEQLHNIKQFMNGSGTMIFMSLSNFSKKTTKEVFDMFSDIENGFTKTHIPIKNIFETYPVSRSQAKRLYHGFDKFQEIELDFKDITEIGQGFAHELFVVFQKQHPDILLLPINVTEDVQKMINHVKNTTL